MSDLKIGDIARVVEAGMSQAPATFPPSTPPTPITVVRNDGPEVVVIVSADAVTEHRVVAWQITNGVAWPLCAVPLVNDAYQSWFVWSENATNPMDGVIATNKDEAIALVRAALTERLLAFTQYLEAS
jgi:hypothetical protein